MSSFNPHYEQFINFYIEMANFKLKMNISGSSSFSQIMDELTQFFQNMYVISKWWKKEPYFGILKQDIVYFVAYINKYIHRNLCGKSSNEYNIDYYYNALELVYSIINE
jgi:hypothetical protein